MLYLEPIRSNFEFGQINVVLMTLVIADCVPRKTPWPRGLLLGVAIALKLTPAVFLLYFLLRRDTRTLVTAALSAVAATLVGMAFAWRDSLQYWTETVHDTDRIGTVTFNTNQNIAGALARLGIDEGPRFVLWTLACFAVLALTVWAVRRILDAHQPVLALVCVALFGLVVSPVSWSHHWVWALPSVLVTAVIGYRQRNLALAAVSAVGIALMVCAALRAAARTPRIGRFGVASTARRAIPVVGARRDRGVRGGGRQAHAATRRRGASRRGRRALRWPRPTSRRQAQPAADSGMRAAGLALAAWALSLTSAAYRSTYS